MDPRVWRTVAEIGKALGQIEVTLDAKNKQIAALEAELSAWKEAFGTTQLTHATERLRKAEAEVERMRGQVRHDADPKLHWCQQAAALKAEAERLTAEVQRVTEAGGAEIIELNAEITRLRADLDEAVEALRKLLAESESFTRERCGKSCESYGKGTDAEHTARTFLDTLARHQAQGEGNGERGGE